MSCEKAAETMNTKVRYGSFGADAVLFGEQDPDKFLSTSPPTVAPEGRKGRVPKGPDFGSRQGGDLDTIEGLGNGRGSNHFLLGAEGDGSLPDSTGSTGPEGEAFCVSASDEGPCEVGMSPQDAMGIMDRDASLEESSGGDFLPLMGRGSKSIALFCASILTADKKEALEEGNCFLDAGGAMASPGDDKGIIAVLPVSDVRDRRYRPGYRSHYSVKLKHRQGIPLKCSPLPAARGPDGPVKEQAGREMLVKPLKGANDTLAHSKRSKGPVGDVGRDGVETFLDIPTSSANLRFLSPLGREVSVFDFEGKGAEDLGAVPTGNAADKGRGKPTKHPLIGVAHAKFGPSTIDEGGNRYWALLDRIGTAFALGGEGNPDLCDGTGPSAIVLDNGEKLGKAVPDR
jgi:hypothetical protein